MANRPLSPHVCVYRFAYTMALSILHRITGLALSAGLLLLVVFLASVAKGEASYSAFRMFAGSIVGRLLIASFLIGFCYHLANGIRHLFWDMGLGLERAQARRSGTVVVAVTVVAAALVLWRVLASRGGSMSDPAQALSRVLGRGSAHEGAHHWCVQRLTALAC